MPLICKVSGCNKPKVALSLCDRHYRIFKKYGHTNNEKTMNFICITCENKFQIKVPLRNSNSRKYCSEVCRKKNFVKNAPLCKVEGCPKKSIKMKGGYCTTHTSRNYKHGDPNVVIKLSKYPEDSKCKIEGCNKNPIARSMCNQHYSMWRKHGNPLAGAYRMPFKKALDHGDGTRTCTKCNEKLPISAFHKDKSATGGVRATCKNCRIKHVKNWYQDNRERQSGKEKNRRQSNKDKYTEKEAKRYIKDREKRIALATEQSHLRRSRKKKTKTERGISKLSLKRKHGTKCYYCGKEMDFKVGVGRKFNRDMATIEHLIPLAKGGEHTSENTVLACRHCNLSKSAKSESEFEEENNK